MPSRTKYRRQRTRDPVGGGFCSRGPAAAALVECANKVLTRFASHRGANGNPRNDVFPRSRGRNANRVPRGSVREASREQSTHESRSEQSTDVSDRLIDRCEPGRALEHIAAACPPVTDLLRRPERSFWPAEGRVRFATSIKIGERAFSIPAAFHHFQN